MSNFNPQTTSIFSLPTEIRRMIYRRVLKQDRPIILCTERKWYTVPQDMDRKLFSFTEEASMHKRDDIEDKLGTSIERPPTPDATEEPVRYTALLEVCRQINDEATPFLYSQNMIVINSPCEDGLTHWPLILREAPHLERLTIWVGPHTMNQFLFWAHGCDIILAIPSLKRITVLFQEDICGMDEEQMEAAYHSVKDYLTWRPGLTPQTIDVGFYPSLRYAFNALSGSYK
ncbi:hypothetical protein Daesc_002796 [Daldinia eschscholtzii]|uniref:DUF7730 domain-containing protein n=1 Tax=Daldinia eschscholtzii TaxID=292717 RepID=A0AAX6MRC1_9PEZI